MITFFKEAFRRSLKKRPILTNTLVYASFYSAADISQKTFKRMREVDESRKPEYKLLETAKLAAVGSTIYAPALYFFYRFLDSKFPGASLKVVLIKLVADQGFMTPTLLSAFFIAMAVVERRANLFEEFNQKFLHAYLANQTFWIPAQTINFFFVPPYLRVVYVATASFLWINVLCHIKRQELTSEV